MAPSKPHRSQQHRRMLLLAAVALASTLGLLPSCALFHKEEEMSLLDNVELLQKLGTLNGYRVGGLITGLPTGASVTLSLNGANAQTFTSNGPFYMSTRLGDGTAYTLSVSTQPYGQASAVEAGCLVDPATGTIPGGDVSLIYVSCGMLGWRDSAGQITSGIPADTDMVFDGSGRLLVAAASSTATEVFSFDGAWSQLGTAQSYGCAAGPCLSMAVNNSGVPYLAVANGSSQAVLSFATGSWATTGAMGGSGSTSPGLTFAADGRAVLSTVSSSAYYIHRHDGANWSTSTFAQSMATASASRSVMDAAGHLWTAVCEDSTNLRVYRDGTPGPSLGACSAGNYDLDIDSAGAVYVALAGGASLSVYRSTDNATWPSIHSYPATGATSVHFRVNSQGHMMLAFFLTYTYVQTFVGGAWSSPVTPPPMGTFTPLSMSLNAVGRPCLLRYDTAALKALCYAP